MMLFFLGFPSRYLCHHMPPPHPTPQQGSMLWKAVCPSGSDTKDLACEEGGFQGFQWQCFNTVSVQRFRQWLQSLFQPQLPAVLEVHRFSVLLASLLFPSPPKSRDLPASPIQLHLRGQPQETIIAGYELFERTIPTGYKFLFKIRNNSIITLPL